MGTGIICDGDFSGLPYGVALPASNAAVWSLFGGSESDSLRNLALPNKPLTKFGTPTFSVNHVSVSGNSPTPNLLQSSAVETVAMTFFAVAKKTEVGSNFRMITNLDGTNWVTLYLSDTQAAFRALYNNAGLTAGVTTTTTSWGLYVGRVDASNIEVMDKTANKKDVKTAPSGRIPSNTKMIRFGGAYQTSGVTNSGGDMAFGAIYNRSLTDSEVGACVDRIRQLMAARGITV